MGLILGALSLIVNQVSKPEITGEPAFAAERTTDGKGID
jgi:hypothetical protein